jgi:hypothetical protein
VRTSKARDLPLNRRAIGTLRRRGFRHRGVYIFDHVTEQAVAFAICTFSDRRNIGSIFRVQQTEFGGGQVMGPAAEFNDRGQQPSFFTMLASCGQTSDRSSLLEVRDGQRPQSGGVPPAGRCDGRKPDLRCDVDVRSEVATMSEMRVGCVYILGDERTRDKVRTRALQTPPQGRPRE